MSFATATLAPLFQNIVLAWGWRRAAIAFAAGAASTLALAPANAWPLLFITFPVLVWLLDGAGAGRLGGVASAAVTGWFFGFGYFFAGLYWTGFAFLVDAKTFGWLLPFAVTALPAGLALFTAAGCALARLLWSRGALRIVALAAALTGLEWLRGTVLSGFPWNAFGYALTGSLALAQGAAFVGLWGLTFIAVLVFASPAVLLDDAKHTPRPWIYPSAAVLLLMAISAYGTIRLAQSETQAVPGIRLRIMQPNIPQDEKFNYGAKDAVMRRYLALSDREKGPGASGLRDTTHLIWPESAFPFFLAREPAALAQIASLLPQGTVLITGAARPAVSNGDRTARAYNSIYVIDHDGSILSIYDKMHLVPFGEYLPFQDALERLGLMQLTRVKGGFVAGERRRAIDVPPAPAFLPLICYEIIFPGEAVPPDEKPGWLLNVTNDGWFGKSAGPYQHLQQARVRAIEEGLPLVRAANTGISAVIDPVGRVVASLPLGAEDVLDAPLPRALAGTPFRHFGNTVAAVFLLFAFVFVIRKRLSV